MLRKFLNLILVLLVLFGCSSKKTEVENNRVYSVLAPNGAPAISLLDLVNDTNYDFDFVDGADVIQAEFSKGDKDFIIAPINLGYKLSQKTGNYELKGVVTWGNLYLISLNNENIENPKIAAFGEAAVPGKIVNLLVEKKILNSDITWFPSVQDAATAFLSGEFDEAIVAEPYLTNLEFQNGELKVIASIQDLYKEATGLSSYPQAAIFVNSKLVDENSTAIDEFTSRIKISIEDMTNNPEVLDKKLGEVDISMMGFNNKKIILSSYTNLGLKYVDSNDAKEEITSLLKLFNIEYK